MAILRAYDATNRAYGGAVMTLLTEMSRHPELRDAGGVLLPNLQNAARVIAHHQQRGAVGPGDPLQKVGYLLAPLIAARLWIRAGITTSSEQSPHVTPELHPEAIVAAFLGGHGAPVSRR